MPSAKRTPKRSSLVPIVGVGASAGGLRAIENLLSSIPFPCGRAFVVIQHLSPNRPGALVELLRRRVSVPVSEIRHGMIVRPDEIYVIPPANNIAIKGERFRVSQPSERRGLRLPIDFFFSSIASEQSAAAVGVILSGMGNDGTQGLRAIKAAGGRCFAQAPTSAQFDGMPQSAIDAGVIDAMGTPAELARAILTSAARRRTVGESMNERIPAREQRVIRHILERVLAETGQDFNNYKPSIVRRRMARRMEAMNVSSLTRYASIIDAQPEEANLLAQSFLIGVTSFFRDPGTWDYLANTTIPGMLDKLPRNHVVRAWIPGCATGEEAYTLAIVLIEALDQLPAHRRPSLRLFATDLDPDSIEFARQGLYESDACEHLSAERLQRWFTEEQGRYRVRPVIREVLVFATHDLISDPPFTKVDLVTCRNVMIYLGSDIQRRLVEKFHYCLNPGGLLVLGNSEATPLGDASFAQVQSQQKVFRRVTAPTRRGSVATVGGMRAPIRSRRAMGLNPKPADLSLFAAHALIENFALAAVVIFPQGDILHVLGKIGKFLEPGSGKASLNVFGMARPSIRRALVDTMRSVTNGRVAKATRFGAAASGRRTVQRVTVRKLTTPESLRGLLLVAFDEVQTAPARGISTSARGYARSLRRVEQELEEMRQENSNAGQQLTTANEELQALNEELQSANEELVTSKEETQSMNEELQTVNAELQSKLDNYTVVNNDLRNLLDSVEMAILFLDKHSNIRRFTPQTIKVFRLIPGDVGRALTDVQSDFLDWDPKIDVANVLATLVVVEKELLANKDRCYLARILPYRTTDNVIDGVVITLTDISAAKRLERTLRMREES